MSPLHQCVPRITISVMRSSSPRWLIVTPPACSIALRHSWLDISRRKRPRRLRGYFLGDDPSRCLGERHFLGAPQLEIAAHPVFPPGLDRTIDDNLPALHLQGNPRLPAAPGPLQGRAAGADRYLRHRPFQLSPIEARSRTSSGVAGEDFPRFGVTVMGSPSSSEGREEPPRARQQGRTAAAVLSGLEHCMAMVPRATIIRPATKPSKAIRELFPTVSRRAEVTWLRPPFRVCYKGGVTFGWGALCRATRRIQQPPKMGVG